MRRLLGSTSLKVIAVILFSLCLGFLLLNAVTFVDYVNLGVYDTATKFYYNNTEIASRVWRIGNELEEDIEVAIIEGYNGNVNVENEIKSIIETKFPNGTNVQFVIRDSKGNVLYSSYTYGRPQVSEYQLDAYNHYGSAYTLYSSFDFHEAGISLFDLGHISFYMDDLSESLIDDDFKELYMQFGEFVEDRDDLITRLCINSVIALFCIIWVMAACGYDGKEGPANLRFYDRIPLEIFLAIYLLLFAGAIALIDEIGHEYSVVGQYLNNVIVPIVMVLSPVVLIFFASLTNRIKTKTFFKNTVCGLLLSFLWKVFKIAFKKTSFIFVHIPLVGRSILLFFAYVFVSSMLLIGFLEYEWSALFLWAVFNIMVLGLFVWRAIILQFIKKGGERIHNGDYDSKIDTSIMYLDYKKFAEYLNSIGNGLNSAVEERMKSERLKSELITNVSHDLKTPLTSIINYVDLLKNEEKGSPKADEYIEVLDRQAKRMKKLTEDLIFASKASSGTEKVALENINVSEFIGQAIAEYSDKLEKAELNVILSERIPAGTTVLADGRLLWRIMDNIFGNVYKYAQPGTRVYVETTETSETVTVAVKNISKESLNISAEELMQRFVRGDSSRSGDGSGLGLSIAKDLAHLQNGSFEITVDGDLFKSAVTLRKN